MSDDVPELDFGGKDFRIFYQKRYTTDAVAPDGKESGDVLNDAVYRRNVSMEERFNVKVVGIEGEEDAMVSTLMKAVAAGEDAYDLFLGHTALSGKAALSGYFHNWYNIPHINFDKPWFPQSTIEQLRLNDSMYMAMSDLCLSFASNTYCVYYNKAMLANYDITNIYDLVREGKWTIDAMADISKELYQDLNGSGTADKGDQFGFGSPFSSHCATWPIACAVSTVQFNDDGTVTSIMASERAATMTEKLRDLYNNNVGSYLHTSKGAGEDEMETEFMNGNIGFITNGLILAESVLRDVEFDYGIIPYPKMDEAQDTYYTRVEGGNMSFVPTTCADPDFAGAMMEAYACEFKNTVLPAYYETGLKVKYSRDDASGRILDMMMENRIYDLGDTIYCIQLRDGFVVSTFNSKKAVTASVIRRSEKNVTKAIEKIVTNLAE